MTREGEGQHNHSGPSSTRYATGRLSLAADQHAPGSFMPPPSMTTQQGTHGTERRSLDQPDHGRRSTFKRRSGGFLLHDSLAHNKRRSAVHTTGRQQDDIDTSADSIAEEGLLPADSPRSSQSLKRQGKAPMYGNGHRKQYGNGLQATSVDGAAERSVSLNSHDSSTSHASDNPSVSSVLDPKQLISMALSLSEGRRRAASGVYSPPKPKPERRAVSHGSKAMSPDRDFFLPEQQQRSSTVKVTADGRIDFPGVSEHGKRPPIVEEPALDFSISTLQRAERAIRYFETCHQYRRLLASMPPLRPFSDDGTLGRDYNPLQFLRNERLRAERGVALHPTAESFDHIDTVKNYVDRVESEAEATRSLSTDSSFSLPDPPSPRSDGPDRMTHRRQGTAASRILYFDSPWSVAPSALFADTHWSEMAENKSSLRDRQNKRIFPSLPKQPLSIVTTDQGQNVQRRLSRSNTNEDSAIEGGETQGRGRTKRNFLSIHRLNDDSGKRISWNRRSSRSSSRPSTRSSFSAFGTFGIFGTSAVDGINIGPLIRHMSKQIDQAQNDQGSEVLSPDKAWDELSTERFPDAPIDMDEEGSNVANDSRGATMPLPAIPQRSRSFSEGVASAAIRRKSLGWAGDEQTKGVNTNRREGENQLDAKRLPQIASLRQGNIEITDFAATDGATKLPVDDRSWDLDEGRRSFESTAFFPDVDRSISAFQFSRRTMTDDSDSRKPAQARGMSKLLRGNRIAGLIRGDGFRRPEKLQDVSRGHSTVTLGSDIGPDNTSNAGVVKMLSRTNTDRSTNEEAMGKSAIAAFKFPSGIDRIEQTKIDVVDGNIGAGKLADRGHKKDNSRALRGEAVAIGEPTSKQTATPGLRGLLSPMKRFRSSSNPKAPTLSTFGGTLTSPLQKETSFDDQYMAPASTTSPRKRQWSIADRLDRPSPATQETITLRDVDRVRGLFLSSGIKAFEMCRRANAVPDRPSKWLELVHKHSKTRPRPVAAISECRTAGDLLSTAIAELQRTADLEYIAFRDERIPRTRDGMEKLRRVAGDELALQVQMTADRADGLMTELTTQHTFAVKQVVDSAERLLRGRRRKFRWIKRIGFGTLEWLVLSLMWFAWLVFVLIKTVKRVVYGGVKAVGWLLWMRP